MKNSKIKIAALPPLHKEFWAENKRFIKIGTSGKIYYTDEGKAEYRAFFARYGYVLENVATLNDFRRVLRDINAFQAQQSAESLLELLSDPTTSAVERAAIALTLGVSLPLKLERHAASNVVSLSEWRSRKKARG